MNRDKKTFSFFIQKRNALVRGYSIDPGEQLAVFPKGIYTLVDFDKNFLGNVMRIIMVDDHLSCQAVNTLLVRPNQEIKPVVVGGRVSEFFE